MPPFSGNGQPMGTQGLGAGALYPGAGLTNSDEDMVNAMASVFDPMDMVKQALLSNASAALDEAAATKQAFAAQVAQRRRIQRYGVQGRQVLNLSPEDVLGNTLMDASPVDNMPVHRRNNETERTLRSIDITARTERGQSIPDSMKAGMDPAEVDRAMMLGADNERARREGLAFPETPLVPRGVDKPGAIHDGVLRPGDTGFDSPADLEGKLFDARVSKAQVYDKFVQDNGYHADMFRNADGTPMDVMDGARIIAEQLQAARRRQGDPWAFAIGESM